MKDSYCSVFLEELSDVVVKDMKEDTLLSMLCQVISFPFVSVSQTPLLI